MFGFLEGSHWRDQYHGFVTVSELIGNDEWMFARGGM